jgi:RNA polymerase sigma-70 factor, ECF subfamily
MDEREWLAQRFQEHRPRLRAVAYRMLGSTSEADDALQEAWIRLCRSNAGEIDNLEAWLLTVVGRGALNMLRSRKSRREGLLDAQHLPDPIVDRADGIDPEHEALLADSLGLALLVVLEALTPAERLAYVLHDMFSGPFEQIGAILERSPQAARQLASRGRRRIRAAHTTPHHADAPAHQEEVVEAFLAAARDGDFDALVAVLDPDIVERVDTASGTIVEVRGAQKVARRAMAASQRDGLVGRRALINGVAGWVSVLDGELFAISAP